MVYILNYNNILFKRISMFKQFKAVKALALVTAITVSGQLFAGPPSSTTTTSSTSSASATVYGTSGTGGYYSYSSVATTPGAVVTEPSLMAIKVTKIMGLVGAVTAEAADAMNGNKTGTAAAGAGADAGVKLAGSSGSAHRASTWLRVSYGALDNAVKDQLWNGKSYLTMVGADYKFNSMFCAGLGLSYGHLDVRTEFNNGNMKQDTLGVNPYLIIVPHKNFNVEFVGGWSTTKGKDDRRWITTKPTGAGNVAVDNKFSCSPKSKAMFGGVFANFVNRVNKASFSLQVGYLMMQSKMNAFKETSASADYSANAADVKSGTFKTQTATAKVLVGYQMTPSVMPFLNIHGQYDVKKNAAATIGDSGTNKGYQVNRSAFGGGAGLQVKNDDQLSGSLQFDYTKRGQLTTNVTGLRLHYGF